MWELEWDLPDGTSVSDVLARYSTPNLLQKIDEKLHVQVVEHRGMYNLGKGIQECTKKAILSAIGEGRRNLCEIDIALTADGVPIVAHEFNVFRVAALDEDKPVRKFLSHQIVGRPIIIREIENGKISETNYRVTDQTISTLEDILDSAIQVNPHATFILDGREDEAHLIVAWLSYRSAYFGKVALLFYTFKYTDGVHFVQLVESADPEPRWRQTVPLMPMLFPMEMVRIAKNLGHSHPTSDEIYEAAKRWIDSVLAQDICIFAVQTMLSYVSEDTLEDAATEDERLAYRASEASARLAYYVKFDRDVKKARPNLKLSTGTRTYDFSAVTQGIRLQFHNEFFTGREETWDTDLRHYIRSRQGTPGIPLLHDLPDLVISDRSEDDMALLAWKNAGVERRVDVQAPHLDVYNSEEE
ncbi:glycerophosphodiester phosphodiesterase family protein [Agrobacterium tumefaciens]|uniref:glycerophosphodiester phosphodiesterase family protein n=1 Tax=Agrobacterium tumefaciens TaxID=358 RepID=UPI00157160C6|nr:glycerophosphodiester phosphodiesterase family protein [Agrobacterium tumefaciens]WCK69419.1 glycerophosphodiester phosphodiesterase family protein [Agrobacterium tumefaciens]